MEVRTPLACKFVASQDGAIIFEHMAKELATIDAEDLRSRVHELRRFL
jgi:hypothetical protein